VIAVIVTADTGLTDIVQIGIVRTDIVTGALTVVIAAVIGITVIVTEIIGIITVIGIITAPIDGTIPVITRPIAQIWA